MLFLLFANNKSVMSGLTAPGHNWAGPFNDLNQPPPTNFTDRVSQQHDFDYEDIGKSHPRAWVNPAYWKYSQADQDFIDAHNQNPGAGSWAGSIGNFVFKAKRAFSPRVDGVEPVSRKWKQRKNLSNVRMPGGLRKNQRRVTRNTRSSQLIIQAKRRGSGPWNNNRSSFATIVQEPLAPVRQLGIHSVWPERRRKVPYKGVLGGRVGPIAARKRYTLSRRMASRRVPKSYVQGGCRPGRAQSTLVAGTGGFDGIEKKFVDTTHALSAITSNDTYVELPALTSEVLNGLVQGAGASERVGRKVEFQHLAIQGSVFMDANLVAANTPAYLTLWLVLDKQTNAAASVTTNIFAEPPATLKHLSFKNLEFDDRYIIVKKWTFILQPDHAVVSTASSAAVRRRFSLNKKLRVVTEYTATTGNRAAINDNSFQMYACAPTHAANLKVEYTARMRFIG